jgi:membrane protein DedA with SNARE-associated domain
MGPALPGILGSLAPVLNHYGYLAVVGLVLVEGFGVPAPGQTILVAAGVYAGAGQLNILWVAVLGFLAATTGDNIGYAIGHFGGRAAVLRFGRFVGLNNERLNKTEVFFRHHGGKIVPVARFIDGLRQANGIVAGLANMSWWRFLAANATGAALWVTLWTLVGYLAGNHIGVIYAEFKRYETYILIALGIVAAAFIGHWAWRRWRQRTSGGKPGSERVRTAERPRD